MNQEDGVEAHYPVVIEAPAIVDESLLPPPPDVTTLPARPQAERRVYIRKDVEIRRYGLTDGCPGCIAIATKSPPQPHNTACRTRIEGEMAKDPDFKQRLQEARKRRANAEPTAAVVGADDPMGVAGAFGGANGSAGPGLVGAAPPGVAPSTGPTQKSRW